MGDRDVSLESVFSSTTRQEREDDMARRKGIIYALAQAQREAERKRVAQMRALAKAQTQAAREAERAQKAYEKALKANQKEQAKLYTESRIAQVNWQNEQLEQDIIRLNNLLAEVLTRESYIDLQTLKQQPQLPVFNPGPLATQEAPPSWQIYAPPEPTGLQKLLPGAKERYAQEFSKAQELFRGHMAAYNSRETARQHALAEARTAHERQIAEIKQQVAAQHAEIDTLQRAFFANTPSVIEDYFTMVLEASPYPDGFPQQIKLAYVPESKQLVVEYDLPSFEVVPSTGSYKYAKTKDEITEIARSLAQRKTLYSSIVAQITLRTLYELFRADRLGQLDSIVFNGYVEAVDKGTGRPVRTCLVTVRTSRDNFMQLNLSKVDPLACLNVLNASVSKSPAELAPVRPVLEFNMVDPRFIEESDVLSGLDQRPNLMDLTPSEFESLITNLFQKMGLETRLTQASRDGGVDCVAYDTRPILGGKIVIQAKRYKNTVGVSAVRDLYGTMQNEGASKGILITTSGYGQASYDFAEGKPIELFSGSHLLYLLKEHAGIEAKIEIPDGWKDPQMDA
jgi:restriction system protein